MERERKETFGVEIEFVFGEEEEISNAITNSDKLIPADELIFDPSKMNVLGLDGNTSTAELRTPVCNNADEMFISICSIFHTYLYKLIKKEKIGVFTTGFNLNRSLGLHFHTNFSQKTILPNLILVTAYCLKFEDEERFQKRSYAGYGWGESYYFSRKDSEFRQPFSFLFSPLALYCNLKLLETATKCVPSLELKNELRKVHSSILSEPRNEIYEFKPSIEVLKRFLDIDEKLEDLLKRLEENEDIFNPEISFFRNWDEFLKKMFAKRRNEK